MKKTLSIVLALMMVLSTVSLAAPTMVSTVTDANEISVDATEIEKTTLASTTSEAATFKPGVNILTGTEKPLTFDDGTYSVSGLKVLDEAKNTVMTAKGDVASISVVPSPVSPQDGYVVKYDITDLPKDTSKYPRVYFDHKDSSGEYVNKMPKDGRPIYVGYNVLVHNADNLSKTATRYNWIMSTESVNTGHKYNIPRWYLSTETPVWHETKGVNIPIVDGAIPFLQMSYVSGANFTDEKMVKPIFYFDNFMYVPYYKVTYMNGTTELGYVYVLDDGEGNLLESFDPNDYDDKLTLPKTINAWSLTDGGEATHNITLNNEDIVVYGVCEPNFVPGYNMLTGTADPLTFDNLANGTHTGGELYDADGNLVLSYENGKAQTKNINVIDTPVAGETGKALEFSGYGYNASKTCYPKLKFNNYEAPNDGRPVLIKLDAFSKKLYDESTTKLTSSATAVYPLYNGGDNGVFSIKLYDYNAAPAWAHGFQKDEKSGANGLATIQFSASVTTDGLAKATTEGVDIVHHFVDNVGFYPYYKVTYMNGAQKIDSVYVLDDGKGNILSQFNPKHYGVEIPEGKFGWSLTDNGEQTNAVKLENEDIILYATDKNLAVGDTILSFEFNDEKSLEDWSFARIKDNKAAIKDGKLVFTAVIKNGSWDTSFSNEKIRFKVDDVKTVEMRVKIVDERGETPTPVDMSKYACDIHYRIDKTSGWTNNYSENKYSYYTPDEEGYYTFQWTADELAVKGWSGEMNMLRFDPHAALPMEATAYVDYIRFYGDPTEDFKPAAYAPEKREGVSLRVDSEETTGVRFMAAMSNTAREDSALTEYGWLVALAPTLSGAELTHGFTLSNGKTAYIEGKAYDTANNIDKIFNNTDEPDYTIFTAVIVGIPSDKADVEIVVRPFSRASGGAYLYGESRVTSPREVGQKFYDEWVEAGKPETGNYDYLKYQKFIDSLGITK